MKDGAINLTDVIVNRNSRPVLDISKFTVDNGEVVAVIGTNGAGKSTLLQVINLHLSFQQGKMSLFGIDVAKADQVSLRRRCAMVFQETLLLNDTVYNNVALPLRFRGGSAEIIDAKVKEVLALFHCAHLINRLTSRLSGGEAQRVCLARALIFDPELLLLDEPFAALDSLTRNAILAELREVAINRKMTVLLVSHYFSDVLFFAKRAVFLYDGRIIQDDSPENMLRRPANVAVAKLTGMDNIIACHREQNNGESIIRFSNGITFPVKAEKLNREPDFCCLPGDSLFLVNKNLVMNKPQIVIMEGNVQQVVPGVGMYKIIVKTGGLKLIARIARERVAGKVWPGMTVTLAFNSAEAHFI